MALPNDPEIEAFDCGEPEVNAYFRSRQWVKDSKVSPPTYQFLAHDGVQVLGYAAVAERPYPHPDDGSVEKGRYLTIYAAGLRTRYHGQRNPSAPEESFAVSMFRWIEDLARQKPRIIGLSLWVRADNEKAIAFYTKFGFWADPGGPVQRDGGTPHLTMRKLFA